MTPDMPPPAATGWNERWSRPGWDLVFTTLGGRLRSADSLASVPEQHAASVARAASQVCIAATDHNGDLSSSEEVDFFVAVARKVLQRGTRPPVSGRVEAVFAESPWPRGIAAWSEPAGGVDLASSYQLDPTWEQPFWDAAVTRYPRAAAWLFPQASLEGLVGGSVAPDSRRWVDFLFAPPGRRAMVLEIDGGGHLRRADVDAGRDRALAPRISVLRATGREAIDPQGRLLRVLAEFETASSPAREVWPDLIAPATAGRFGLAITEAVARGWLPRGGPWTIEARDGLSLVDELAGPALDQLRAISELWALNVVPESVRVNDRLWHLAGSDPSRGIPRQGPSVRIRLQPTIPYFAELPVAQDVPEIVIRRVGVPAELEWLRQPSTRRRLVARDAPVEPHLQLLMADLFGHEAFREGQAQSIRQVLAGGDAVVLLPTGSGKSLIYQLAGLVSPGTTLVIDPLIALIDDQERRLHEDGIDRVAALHSQKELAEDERDALLESVAAGDALFVFLTPERFQSQRFRERLARTARDRTVNLAVVDEAHCVSEWGHDFRTSYLRLARNIRRLCRDPHDAIPPILALTGTASPAVLRDVLRELEIDPDAEGALQRPSTHDRPNLHYVKRVGPESEWLSLVVDALIAVVPEHLGVAVEDLADLRGSATLSGVVFSPHAGGRHGLEEIRGAVHDGFADRGVRLRSVTYSGKSQDGADNKEWARTRADAARAFKANEVPLLIGTKAFGMGIDKPNIRYTIHAGFPSSLEAFAQEAGRAGRDGAPAVCILTAGMPAADAAEHLLEMEMSAEQRKRLTQQMRDEQGGDLRRQAFFLTSSFPGEDEEGNLTERLYRWMLRKGGQPGTSVTMSLQPRRDQNEKQYREWRSRLDRALYRLSMVGVLDDITIDGWEATLHVARYDADFIDGAFLAYASRVEPGRELAHRDSVSLAPQALEERVSHHVRALIATVYRIVAHARLNALRSMYLLANGPDDPRHIRETLNAYLSSGPAATLLSEAVTISPVDLPRFIAALESLPADDAVELSGAAARQLEAYPDHPLLWFSNALGIARGAGGGLEEFEDAIARAVEELGRYRVDGNEAAAAIAWFVRRLRNENGGRRWDWVPEIYRAWDRTGWSDALLIGLEDEAMALAQRGRANHAELEFVAWRRLRRHAAQSREAADRLVGARTFEGSDG
jgi:ATP-dependent DNA helicase RecQ